MNRYKVLLPLVVHTADNSYEQGEEFDHEFSQADEYENVKSGLLGVVPRRYRVVGTSDVFETKPGDEFERAFLIEEERLLVVSGHIARVEDVDDNDELEADDADSESPNQEEEE